MPPNISRDTSPWSRATPFERAASRSPITAMLNLPSGSSARVPSSNRSSNVTPHSSAKVVEVLLEQVPREAIDAGRHRGVRREHPARPHRFDRLGERQPLLGPLPHPFEAEEPGVALVGVEHLGMQAERPQGPDAADAEHDLLAEPVLLVAAVEPVR